VTTEHLPGAAQRADPRGPSFIGQRVLGAVLLAVGAFLLYDALTAAGDEGFAAQGPRWAPVAVAAGWTLLAAIYLVRAILVPARDYPPDAEPPAAEPPDAQPPAAGSPDAEAAAGAADHAYWLTPALILALLVAYALVYAPLGFVLATVAFFVGAARVLGSRHLVRDLVAGAALAVVAYLAFTRLLDVNLPAGVLPL